MLRNIYTDEVILGNNINLLCETNAIYHKLINYYKSDKIMNELWIWKGQGSTGSIKINSKSNSPK